MNRPIPLPDDWFEVGDIVSRDGTDRHVVVATNEDLDGTAPDLIDVKCIKAPDSGWCVVGHTEFNVPGRYTLVERAAGRNLPGSTVIYLSTP